MISIILKQLIHPEYHDYPENDHYRMADTWTCHVCRMKWLDQKANWNRHLIIKAAPEQELILKQNNQVEYDESAKYHIGRY